MRLKFNQFVLTQPNPYGMARTSMSGDADQTQPTFRQVAESDSNSSFSADSRIGEMLSEFEAAWRAGGEPDIETYVSQVPKEQRGRVREELTRVQAELKGYEQREATLRPVAYVNPDTLQPGTMFGRYQVLKKLGQGGMGCVLMAQDTELNRKVAVKIPLFQGGDSAVLAERFRREAQAAAALHHPQVCPIYDVGEVDGVRYLTMAFIEGQTLEEYAKGQPLPMDDAVRIVSLLAQGLQEAHEHGIIHRDLKPANILMNKRAEPVITDFGLAVIKDAEQDRLTRTGSTVGTPCYMAPEQVKGDIDNIGPASDLYSLGVIFYELLVGEPPFRGTILSLIHAHLNEEPPPPSQLNAQVLPEIEALCLKCLAKNPADRFSSAKELVKAADALRKLVAGFSGALTTPEGSTVGQYRLVERIGSGAMGIVYRAVHRQLDREVALKVLSPSATANASYLARFQREIKVVGKLTHANIVAAHDAGLVDGVHYLTMELVRGSNLEELIQQQGPLPVPEACEIIRQAALGLQHAHEHGLVHRDMKPTNLMVTQDGLVKVLDLGLALLDPAQHDATMLTKNDELMGTLDYMAPEQAQNSRVDIRADLYGLGATLYEMLSGRPPLESEDGSISSKLQALRVQAPSPMKGLRPDVPDGLVELINRLLSKSPDQRPAKPAELVGLLQPFCREAHLERLFGKGLTNTVSDEVSSQPQPENISSEEVPESLQSKLVSGLLQGACLGALLAVIYYFTLANLLKNSNFSLGVAGAIFLFFLLVQTIYRTFEN